MKKILYIEDEMGQIEIVKELLETHGYSLISAISAQDGIDKARDEKPDLILLDIFLPGANGYDLCAQIKKDPLTKSIPILMGTASGEKYMEEKCANAGAEGYILKPYKMYDLLSRIKTTLKDDF